VVGGAGMTNEEAINTFKEWIERDKKMEYADRLENIEIYNMAIQALEQQPCEDAISRQAVLEVIRKCHCEEWVKAYIGAPIEALSPVTPQSKKGRWIPVSERLPKAGEYVGDVDKYYLVQNEYGDMLVARYTHSEYWEQIYQFQPIGDEIVAWMPLPEPYKEVTIDADND
jgi:hypothetical protein